MGRYFLAFRCSGIFDISSSGSDNDWVSVARGAKGVVEIHYAEDAPPAPAGVLPHWRARLRWLPDTPVAEGAGGVADPISADPGADAAAITDLATLTPDILIGLLGSGGVFRSEAVGKILRFEGVRLFEQYDVPQPDAESVGGRVASNLDLRLPTIGSVSEPGGSTLRSALWFGRANGAGYRFVLGIPTPLPIRPDQWGGENLGALWFQVLRTSVVEDIGSHHFTSGAPVGFDTLLFGPREADVEIANSGISRIGRRLFGRGPGLRDPYRSTPEDDASPHWTGTKDVPRVLAALGFEVGKKVAALLTLGSDDDTSVGDDLGTSLPTAAGILESDDSDRGDGTPRFRVLNRIRLVAIAGKTAGTDADDIRVEDGRILLKRSPRKGDYLDVGPILHVLVDAEGEVADPPDADGGSRHEMAVHVAYLWSEGIREEPRFLSGALATLPGRFTTARAGLSALEGAQPGAVIPEISFIGERPTAWLSLSHPARQVLVLEDGLPVAGPASLRGAGIRGIAGARASIVAPRDLPGVGAKVVTAILKFPLFERAPKGPTAVVVALAHDSDVDDAGIDLAGASLSVAIVPDENASAMPLATLGGIAFESVKLYKDRFRRDETRSHLRFHESVRPGDPPDVELKIRFEVGQVVPVGVDRARGDHRRPSVPTMLSEVATGQSAGRFWLIATENLSVGGDRRLRATLRDRVEGGEGQQSFVVLSEAPFALKRAYAVPLSARGDAEAEDAAVWDSETRRWLTRRTAEAYRYVLPPQSIGESMDKPRRLELHDAGDGGAGWISPAPPAAEAHDTAERRRAVEFRLTPPTELWVRPSDVARRFTLPEWAAADIFAQTGELGLGAGLEGLRAEFVYGLPVAVDPSREQGVSRRARVAEVEALLGSPVPGDGDGGGDRGARGATTGGRWNAVLAAYLTRPERLEIWADDIDARESFASARFSSGARFVLRRTALHRDPVADPGVVDDRLPAVVQGAPEQPRFHPHGLSGGALWPIEFRSVLEMVVRSPRATGGSIGRIALSPLGGDADQTVRFANNRVAIITETRGGYVQRQKVEVIGRIAVLWHRAKHVVVYERTVSSSAQFAPEEGGETRSRRPVLRKVREYIEILQPERRYPDVGPAPAHTNGFLAAVRFNSRIIAVDSSWAEDIETVGFEIPLWNRMAARQRPQVYGRPDVVFVTRAEGEDDANEAPQECLDPDNLRFFADASPDATDDTDTWPTRNGIDSTELPPPRHGWPWGPATTDAPLGTESAAQVPPGFARFTWRLATPTARTAINAGRGDSPVYATLETITFTRGVGAASKDRNTTAEALGELAQLEELKKTKFGDGPIAFSGLWKKGGTVATAPDGAVIAELAKVLKDAGAALPAPVDRTVPAGASAKTIGDALAAVTAFKSAKLGDVTSLVKRLEDFGGELDKSFGAWAGKPNLKKLHDHLGDHLGASCDRFKSKLVVKIEARQLAFRQELRAWEADVLRAARRSEADAAEFAGHFDDLKSYLNSELTAFLRPGLDGATVEVGKLGHSIEKVRSAVLEVRARIEADLARLRADVEAIRKSMERGKPWSRSRLERVHQQLLAAFDKGRARLVAAVQDAEALLSAEIDERARPVAAMAVHALSLVTALGADLAAKVETVDAFCDRLDRQAEEFEKRIAGKLTEATAAVELVVPDTPLHGVALQLHGLIDTIAGKTKAAKQAQGALVGSLRNHALETKDHAAALVKNAEAFVTEIAAGADAVLDALKEVGGEADGAITEALADVTAKLKVSLDLVVAPGIAGLATAGDWISMVFVDQAKTIDDVFVRLGTAVADVSHEVDEAAKAALDGVGAVADALRPDALSKTIVTALLTFPAVATAIEQASRAVKAAGSDGEVRLRTAERVFSAVVERLDVDFAEVGAGVVAEIEKVEGFCRGLTDTVKSVFDGMANSFVDAFGSFAVPTAAEIEAALGDFAKYEELLKGFHRFDDDVRRVGNELGRAARQVEAWGNNTLAAVGRIGRNGISTVPGNVLAALAAVGSGPEMPDLDFARARIGYYYGLAKEVVDTTPVEAWFGKLGDSLKAMGLNLPFDRIGDHLLPKDLSTFDLGRILPNFGGLDLSRLFSGVKVPAAAKDAIRITHHFDRKAFRAWVKIDVAVDLPGRNSMVALGPFNLDAVGSKLVGFLKLEASKDSETIEQTGEATLTTDLDAVVSGQSMVKLREVAIRYARSGGLSVDFDPKKLQLNPCFRFVQNTLQTVFGDTFGGCEILKKDGVPVGLRHDFSMPPLSLSFGTSGVQNIQLSNRFELIAHPDFVIANRFALARPEMPFIFTVFIIGGTGWLTVDVEYRPFEGDGELSVVVEAAAGGAASLAFSFAGCTGSVFITISVALRYQKLIGAPGGGLTVSLVVVITGVVDVLGIATALITVALRLSYFENGDIDAVGSFRVTIRISRFFSVSAGGNARYRMTGGKRETSSSTYTDHKFEGTNLQKAQKLLKRS